MYQRLIRGSISPLGLQEGYYIVLSGLGISSVGSGQERVELYLLLFDSSCTVCSSMCFSMNYDIFILYLIPIHAANQVVLYINKLDKLEVI